MKGLVISWFYPPINSSEGLVTFKLINKSTYDYDVYTQKNNTHWSYTSNENALKKDTIHTIFSKEEDPVSWAESCATYFANNSSKYDFIMSRSMPAESHVAAINIKESSPDTVWIASFGDPIYNTPYFNLIAQKMETWPIDYSIAHPKYYSENLKKQLKKILFHRQTRFDRRDEEYRREIENKVLTTANIVIFNNHHQKEFMLEQHGLEDNERYVVIPHPYEKDFYSNSKKKEASNKIVISHVGHLDNIRSAVNLLKAVNRLKKKHPDLYERLELNFYGTLDMHSKLYMVDNNLFDKVHFCKPVSYFESLEVMQESDYNLLVDANLSTVIDKNIYTAGKIADYLGSGKPIFGITMVEGASSDILRETGQIVSSHSEDEIYMNLLGILKNSPPIVVDRGIKNAVSKFDAKNTAKDFDKIVKIELSNRNGSK